MNILITGSSGVIATQLIAYFSDKRENIYTLSRHENSDYMIDLSSENPDFKVIDQTIDVIIHCAYVIPKSFDEDNSTIYSQNKLITDNTVHLTNTLKPKLIIHISSIAVYPNVSGSFSEISELEPEANWNINYGNSKIYTEKTLSEQVNDNTNVCHLRVSQLLADNFTDTLQKSFLNELKEKNTITVFANGNRESNFIYTSKLCKVIEQVMNKQLDGIFNCGDFQQNYLKFAEKFIEDRGNSESKIILVDKGTPTVFKLNCTKLEKSLS